MKASVRSIAPALVLLTVLASIIAATPPSPPAPAAGADKPPVWLTSEAARPLPSLPAEVEAVVLLDEQSTVIGPRGVLTTTFRRATRVLRPGGIEPAQQLITAEAYDTKVKAMTGWVINPSGSTRQMTMKQVISSSLAPDTLYMDVRMMLLAVPEVDVGSVVGFEWQEERTPPSVEDSFEFQGEFPVLRAHYALRLPPDWESEISWVHWPAVEPLRAASAPCVMSIEILDVPAIGDEPFMPESQALAGRLLVRLKTSDPSVRSFKDWADMGAWYAGLSAPRRAVDDAVAKKARELTASAPDTLSKIRVLAEFAQKDIRYVAIQIGIGGFQPHTASSILANRYGDCKDKATLLAAMLGAIGIDSHYIVINTERGGVTLESPVSLYSFNHVILAIRVPDDIPDAGLDSLVRHPSAGRLLVFDPTMPTTPLGRLPYYLQDNTGLLVAGEGGELLLLPRPGPEGNLLDRKGKLTLTGDGALIGEIQETRHGSEADTLRYQMQSATEAERRKFLETFLARSFAAFSLQSFEFKNLEDARADLVVSYRFIASAYAKRAGGYLVIRPRAVGVKAVDIAASGKKPRRYPIDLQLTCLNRDEFAIEIPEGYAVESLPKPVALEAGFAAYASQIQAEGKTIVYKREYRVLDPLLPASRYDEALKFYLAVAAEEQQSLLLKAGGSRRP
jgi:hypothetical protein